MSKQEIIEKSLAHINHVIDYREKNGYNPNHILVNQELYIEISNYLGTSMIRGYQLVPEAHRPVNEISFIIS